jgi:acetolactate synthase-1/3 small subunit
VENKPGVLHNISGLFSRRGFNIDSLAVGTTEDPKLSRMTIVVDGEEHSVEQVTKQLHKLINVIKISELDPKESVERELALFKVNAAAGRRNEIISIADIFRSKIVDVSSNTVTIEATGTSDKIQAIEELLKSYGIIEIVRTGKISISRK